MSRRSMFLITIGMYLLALAILLWGVTQLTGWRLPL